MNHVYLLEDDESARKGLSRLINAFGFLCFSASSRQEFLKTYRKLGVPYAVILDNHAPYDEDDTQLTANVGLGLASHFLRREPETIVILHTSTERNQAIDDYVKKGMIYLPKPADKKDFADALRVQGV
ncbi:response regulator [Candidatus Woesearchaeota archaeon]|nr:response regulator [Candidatus Woesearchaeota archaeon]